MLIVLLLLLCCIWCSANTTFTEHLTNVNPDKWIIPQMPTPVQEVRHHGIITATFNNHNGVIYTIKTHPTKYILLFNEHPGTNIRYDALNIINEKNQTLPNNAYTRRDSNEGFMSIAHELPSNIVVDIIRPLRPHCVLITLKHPEILNRFAFRNLSAGTSPIHIRCVAQNNELLGIYKIRGNLGGANVLS